MKVIILKVGCNSCAHWRTDTGRFSETCKERLTEHSALGVLLSVPGEVSASSAGGSLPGERS